MGDGGVLLLYSPLNEPRQAAVRRLAELHPHLLLITEGIGPGNVPAWATPLLAGALDCVRQDIEVSIARIKEYCAERDSVPVGIVCLSETGMVFCARVAAALHLRFADADTVVLSRDKSAMRRVFEGAGLPTVPSGTAATVEEASAIARGIGYPVVLKPLIAGGSLFIRRINDEEELCESFAELLTSGIRVISQDPLAVEMFKALGRPRLQVEKLIGGTTQFPTRLPLPVGEISVEGCVLDGVVHVLGFHDKPLPANGPYYEEVLWSTPTRTGPRWIEALTHLAQKTVAAVQHDWGVFHMEARTTETGPVLLEIAARMGGGPIYRSLRESTGIDMIEIMYRIATHQDVGSALLSPSHAVPVVTFGLFAEEGRLVRIEGIDEVARHPWVLETPIYEPPNNYIHRAPRSDHCTVHVMVKASSHDEAEDVGLWAERTVRFTTVPDALGRATR